MVSKRPSAAAPIPDKKTRQRRGLETEPRLPHERDESSDSTAGPGDRRIEKAAEDMAAGRQDTTKANELDRTYQRQKRPG